MDKLFGKTIPLLSQVLDYHSKKHSTIVSNIANVDTPGYRARDVMFEKELALRISEGNPARHASTEMKPLIRVIETGNPVSLDRKMSRLAENTIRYNLGVELLARKLRGLRDLVREVR